MKPTAAITILTFAATATAWAGPTCTTVDKSQWQDAATFRQKLEADGYEIKVFKVTDGNCYEIYGWNKEKQKVEIYFDPVTGKAIKTEIG
jgi:hypothetical protein